MRDGVGKSKGVTSKLSTTELGKTISIGKVISKEFVVEPSPKIISKTGVGLGILGQQEDDRKHRLAPPSTTERRSPLEV
jgi:hypothetical protein